MTIGNRIKRRRESLGITQSLLAELIGTTKQNLYKYENDIITNIPSDKVEALAKNLHTTPAYLMGWENPNVTDITIASNIRKYREKFGASQEQVADFVGVDPSVIDEWEKGITYPSVGYAEKICSALTISTDDLKSTPDDIRFKNHEEDYLSDLFEASGFVVFYATSGVDTSVIIGDSSTMFELSAHEFEEFKKSIREYVKYKIYDTIKNRTPLSLGTK